MLRERPQTDRPDGRRQRPLPDDWTWLAALCAVVIAASAALSPRGVDEGPTVCASRRLFDLDCPGCGLTRAFVHTAHGDFAGAWLVHPLGTAAWLCFAVVALHGAAELARDCRMRPVWARRAFRPFIYTWALAIAALGVYRCVA